MRTLVYKRTHNGDPSREGVFGAFDCMGQVRGWAFDAVIGVGGIGDEARRNRIAGKVNWIGLGPHKEPGRRGPVVRFEHFHWLGEKGPYLSKVAPALADRIYGRHVRAMVTGFTEVEEREVRRLLRRAASAPPSTGLKPSTRDGKPVDGSCGVGRKPATVRASVCPPVGSRRSG